MTKVGVCLSGCGVFDGSEIHEAVITLLALDRAGATVVCMAPDVDQAVINHRTGDETDEVRNVLDESARIARGNIRNLADVTIDDIDALVFPGGFGAAKNLCDFATAGDAAKVHPEVTRLVRAALEARKPIGGICIAPALLAAILRDAGLRSTLTIGEDQETAAAIERMGSKHIECSVQDFRVDEDLRLVTTPAYMLAGRISEAADGIEKLVAEVLKLAREPAVAKSS